MENRLFFGRINNPNINSARFYEYVQIDTVGINGLDSELIGSYDEYEKYRETDSIEYVVSGIFPKAYCNGFKRVVGVNEGSFESLEEAIKYAKSITLNGELVDLTTSIIR